MKKFCLMLTLIAAVILTGCRKDNGADVKELFLHIPNTASYVVVQDLHSILEKSGSKIDGGKVEASPELLQLISQSRDERTKQLMRSILDGDSGVAPTVAVIFADGFSQFVVGDLYSTSKFESVVVKFIGGEWEEKDGIRYNANYAITNDRYWIGKEGSRIDIDKIKTYMALSEKQSFADSEFAPMLEDTDADFAGWCDINGVMNVTGIGFERRAMAKMGIEALFKDAGFATFDVRLEKGAMKMSARLLDGKGRDAKFLYPSKKIDESVLAKIGGKADVVGAVAVPQKLVQQIKNQVSGKLSMIGFVVNAMGCVDGTVAVAASPENNGYKGLIQTNGGNTADLMGLLKEMDMNSSKEGSDVLFSKGELSGKEDVSKLGENIKGSIFGVSINPSTIDPNYSAFSNIAVKLVPHSGSVRFEVNVAGHNPGENIMVTLLKVAAGNGKVAAPAN